MRHLLKTWPDAFCAVRDRKKHCDIRREDDRKFAVGDVICMKEFLPEQNAYTGRWLDVRVSHVVRGPE